MSVQVSYKKQFLLGIMFLILIIASVEGIARFTEIFYPQCRFVYQEAFKDDFFLVRQMCTEQLSLSFQQDKTFDQPFRVIEPNQHYKTVNINAHGFRGPEILKEKPENTYRIFILGGSTAFGVGATSDETTIAGYLQQKFDQTSLDFRVEVINAGVSGHESFRETHIVKNKLIEFEPDLIIAYDGVNDAFIYDHEIDSSGNYIIPKKIDEKQIEDDVPEKKLFRFADYEFYRTPFVIFRYVLNPVNYNEVSPIENYFVSNELPSIWKDRWNEICELGMNKGFDTLITTHPMVGIGKKPLTSAEMVIYRNATIWEAPLQNYEGMVNNLKELDRTCTKTSDIRNVFENVTETIYMDNSHVIDIGNEIIAQKLYELSFPIIEN